MKNVLVILPTYNEADNIGNLIEAINKENKNFHICVVDDNSPDGTGQIVKAMQARPEFKDTLFLMERAGKSGRGDAVRAGLKEGLSRSSSSYDILIEMDCDFSHDPKYLSAGIELLERYDVVMGSRYPDGAIEGWPWLRKTLSFCSNTLIRTLLKWEIADYTNGYRFYNRHAAEFLCDVKQGHKGYIYLSETLAYLIKADFTIGSFPIVFVNREKGKSNTSFSEVFNSLIAIFQIALNFHFSSKKKLATAKSTTP